MAQITARAFFNKGAILFSGIAMICFAQGAEAGFEWKGPLAPPAPVAAETREVPATESLSGLEPVIMWDGTPSAGAPAMPAEKVAPVENMPVAQIAAETKEENEPEDMEVFAAEDAGEMISGFGTDLPLVIALQQVAPAGYQFSFAKDVNPGATVSWEGGRPWKTALADMLQGAGLGYRLQNNIIVVGKPASSEISAQAKIVSTPSPVPVMEVPAVPAVPPMPVQEPTPLADPVTAPAPSSKVEQIPDDLTAPPAALTGTAPVDIRRQKPSKLLKRMTTWGDESSAEEPAAPLAPAAETVQAQEVKEMASAPATAQAVAKPVAAVEPAAPVSPQWQAAQGQTLREVLKKWSDAAGAELYWSIDYDYRLGGDVSYTSSFEDAVAKLLEHYGDVRPQPYGQIHRTAEGSRVLVIKSYDLTP